MKTKRPIPSQRATMFEGMAQTRRVLITGANRGLGLEFTRQSLKAGHLVFAGARDPDRASGLDDLRAGFGAQLHLVRMDITDQRSIDAAIGQISATVTGLDLLINNAGINAMSREIGDPRQFLNFGQLSAEALTTMFRTNAVGPLMVAQSAHTLLKAGARPVLVNITSWMGSLLQHNTGGNYAYSASKVALNMITRSLAFDLAESNIIVVALNPGWVQTDMGGPKAPLSPADAVEAIHKVIDTLSAGDSGLFLHWDGTEHPW